MTRNYFVALCFLILFAPTSLFASDGYRKGQATSMEVLALPQFCWWEFDAAYKDTKKQIQNCGTGMNHYCGALLRFNRAQRMSERYKKVGELKRALGGVEYTLRWMNDTKSVNSCSITEHVLQSYKNIRMAHAGVGLPVPPDKYPVSMGGSSNHHPILGKAPKHEDTKQPQLRGDTDGIDSTKEVASEGAELPGGSSAPSGSTDANAVGTASNEFPNKQTQTASPESDAAKIGSPSNPYCRFCPD